MATIMARQAMDEAEERGAKIMSDKMIKRASLRWKVPRCIHPVCGGEIWASGTRMFCIKCREIISERYDIPSKYHE